MFSHFFKSLSTLLLSRVAIRSPHEASFRTVAAAAVVVVAAVAAVAVVQGLNLIASR
jgi:hypothetical protein